MDTTRFIKIRKSVKFFFLFGAVVLLSYCTSSNKVASSFGKRKYTPGHFFNPVAKQKVNYAPCGANAVNTPVSQTQIAEAENNAFANAVPTNINANLNAPGKLGAMVITKAPTTIYTNYTSIKEAMPYDPNDRYGDDHGHDHHSSNANSFLLGWVICLVLAVICFALLYGITTGTAVAIGSEVGVGCFLSVIGIFTFVGAIVLFIFWIIALSRG